MTAEFLEIGLAVVWRESRSGPEVLISRRSAGTHLAGYWELPGGKVEEGESPETSARRELAEETGIHLPPHLARAERLTIVEHAYPERTVRLHVFLLRGENALTTSAVGQELEVRWVAAAALDTFRFPPANDAIIRAIIKRLTTNERDDQSRS